MTHPTDQPLPDLIDRLRDLRGPFLGDGHQTIDAREIIAELARLRAEVVAAKDQRDIAIDMLAQWCEAVEKNGTGWDYWVGHYKDAAYRPGPLRELIDRARAEHAALTNRKD